MAESMLAEQFLSPPSARRATAIAIAQAAEASVFLSPPSARRATREERLRANLSQISIPALREEGDTRRTAIVTPSSNFYPRPPRGGRRVMPVRSANVI